MGEWINDELVGACLLKVYKGSFYQLKRSKGKFSYSLLPDPYDEDKIVKYCGCVDDQGCKEGIGFTEHDGNTYKGQYLNDKRNGFGKVTYSNGY
mmetsp:Transcript_45213/g.61332  ORF Transcript_45213/g.61332 Transcript_45213/m.61332 type:complete len:94 (+) Transcript_45213:459-740(+)